MEGEQQHRDFSVGIIGAGEIAAKVHLPVLEQIPSVKIDWIADVRAERATAVATAFNVHALPVPRDLKELPPADVTVLAIPYGSRPPYYEALRKRPGALYVEKPFARSIREHRHLCETFGDYRLGCGLQRRSWGPTQLIRRLVADNIFGAMRAARFEHGGPGLTVGSGYSANVQLAGGGPLFESGIHGIDAVLFCANAAAVEVRRAEMVAEQGFDLHTQAEIIATDAEGNAIEVNLMVSCLQETTNRIEFEFDRGIVSYCLFREDPVTVRRRSGHGSYTLLPDPAWEYPISVFETFYAHWTRFLAGLQERRANWTSASHSQLTTAVIEGIYAAQSRTDTMKTDGRAQDSMRLLESSI